MARILVVDDEQAARLGMRKVLERAGFDVLEATDGPGALESVRRDAPEIVLLDVNIPGPDGLEVLRRISGGPDAPLVIMITAYGSERMAAEAIKQGAYDYIPKPYELEELRAAVRRAAETIELRRETLRLRAELERLGSYGEILGVSAPMRRVFAQIDKVSQADVTVLIRGESGTGKEMAAREIHRRSARRDGPFIVMNCAAMPETLVESELFGHAKGAFTGADTNRIGKFQAADGGTLMLDEVGDMSPGTQAKVLRVLQESAFEPLGSVEPVRVNVRIISATNQDLERGIENEEFRRDLYHRLKVVEIVLPPLRDRGEDIALLAEHFLELFRARYPDGPRRFAPSTVRLLHRYHWPGNVRELKHVVESALVLAAGPEILPEHLSLEQEPAAAVAPEAIRTDLSLPYKEARQALLEEFDRRAIERALDACDGNVSHAAERLDMYRQSLQSKMRRLGIRRDASAPPTRREDE
ncbi:MAG: sigma-54-dependent Fis family transcriptional regulator [Candidatus Brocadiaceae bacterium]|nr:sigma-54-dependent Fis family transcriptional regulator [Candidatus Brocadiaceae bacterium]